MIRGIILTLILVVVAVIAGCWFLLNHFGISALQPPGRVEIFLSAQARHHLIARAAKEPLPSEPANTAENVEDGHVLYGSLCAGCHGYDGRTPTPLGNSIYPRTPSLASSDVQEYSNAEIFVVIRGGIRLSGMPGFGHTHTSDEIWSLVHYVRSLPNAPVHH